MKTQSIILSLSRCEDLGVLRDLRERITSRILTLEKRRHQANQAEAWARVKGLRPGTIVYCANEGVFLGASAQRGDEGIVYAIQPRKKRIWVDWKTGDWKGKRFWFSPGGVLRYRLQVEKPSSSVSEGTKRTVTAIGSVLNNVLAGQGVASVN